MLQVENGLFLCLIEGQQPFNLEDRMDYYKVPGISIAVIKDFKIEWSKQYGVMDSETQNPVTERQYLMSAHLVKALLL